MELRYNTPVGEKKKMVQLLYTMRKKMEPRCCTIHHCGKMKLIYNTALGEKIETRYTIHHWERQWNRGLHILK
jgi:hypothetical protein